MSPEILHPHPIRLPKFTMIVGGTPDDRRELSLAIAARDPGMIVERLRDPLRVASGVLFFDARSPNVEALLQQPLPFRHPIGGLDDWLGEFEATLQAFAGPAALADILLPRIIEELDFAARFLIPDCDEGANLDRLLQAFAPGNCMLITIGTKPSRVITGPFAISVYGSVEEQLLQLEQTTALLPL